MALATVFREFTSEMLRVPILLLLLLVASPLCLSQQGGTQAVLFKRYDHGGGQNRLIEDTLSLKLDVKPEQRFTVAVRVCSKQPLPFALVTANAEPFFISEWLVDAYAYPRDRVVFVRSEDCLGKDPAHGITEIWTLSEGASLPPHIEKLVSTDAHWVALGKKPARLEIGVRDYKRAVDDLIKELKHDPAARGVVIGFFMKRPGLTLRRRIREVNRTFARSGLPRDRYLVYTDYYNGEAADDAPEPQYPAVYIIKKVD